MFYKIRAMKVKNKSLMSSVRTFSGFNTKYQISRDYWKQREKECEKNLSKFC